MIGINKCLNPGQQIVAQDFFVSCIYAYAFLFLLYFTELLTVYSNVNYVLLFTLHKSDVFH